MKDDILPYGNFFQAPLNIKHGDVSIYWDYNDSRTVIWSDHVAVAAPILTSSASFVWISLIAVNHGWHFTPRLTPMMRVKPGDIYRRWHWALS
nr:hypothetical protein [Enterovibrio nigricans]